ncbi:hypothetical protein Krac_6961 [Ktedonobacter racemifer DSM 44963]|uniref:Uncharacterized protein n=1 Tax=Ktedonobacter racemifer DSM 44963 TaxID=485913 RepID=D6TQ80_KTERA|nr:hypothetical protein Krac_6961 [Ktedonobacter racemifer DSM 44963]
MSDRTANQCNFCAKVNREEATTCEVCGHELHRATELQSSQTNGRKKGLRFILSRIGAVDALHLHLH